MRFFQNYSITTKLNVSALVAGGSALLLASAALIVNDANLIRSSKEQQLSALAKVMGANCTAALTFDDPAAAKELLSSLGLQPTIVGACVYNAKNRPFAIYSAAAKSDFKPPDAPPSDSERVEGNVMEISHEIVNRDNERVGTVFLRASMSDLNQQLVRNVMTVMVVMVGAMVVVLFFSSRLQRSVSEPILRLASTAQAISQNRDYSVRVVKAANDELGTLYDEFNAMLEQIQRGERELQHAHNELEIRVQERTRELSHANLQLSGEISERKKTEAELETVHRQLVEAARRAGMAEVATGVLHNVGNVLNSVNVSATLVADRLRNSKLVEVERALNLLNEHTEDIGNFLVNDERGKRIPSFLHLVTSHMSRDRSVIMEELVSLTKNVDHIKTIVAMQQSYAGAAGVVELVSLSELVEDSLRLNASSFKKYNITIVRSFAEIPEVRMEKPKLLQILVNLVTNAKDSLIECDSSDRVLTVRIRVDAEGKVPGQPRVIIDVSDNGIGIVAENLTRIFSHGFTTKRHGHGFGLHSSANAAKELGGTLSANSEGPGHGATFILDLPFKPVEVLV